VILVGAFPNWPPALPSFLMDAYEATGTVPSRLLPAHHDQTATLDEELQAMAEASGAEFISVLDILCRPDGCLTKVSGELTTFDYGHLGIAAAALVVGGWSTVARPVGEY
jgi:hypothetical protein